MYDLGSTLKRIRLQRGLTQKALAQRINKSVSAVSSYESNAQQPPLDVLESIAVTLNVSIDYIVGLNTDNSLSLQDLNSEQKEIIELLFKYFYGPEPTDNTLTTEQITILQKLFRLFSMHNKKGE